MKYLCTFFFFCFRMVTFSNNVEPANGFLTRYLHRKLMESEDERSLNNEDLIRVLDWVPKLWYHLHTFLEKHSTSDFLIGMENTKKKTPIITFSSAIMCVIYISSLLFWLLFRPLLFPVLPSFSWWISVLVHWSVEPLYYSIPARRSKRWCQGKISSHMRNFLK